MFANWEVVRVIAHTQVRKLGLAGQKKAHVMEIQLNGGYVTITWWHFNDYNYACTTLRPPGLMLNMYP
jgi:hypothetical protein